MISIKGRLSLKIFVQDFHKMVDNKQYESDHLLVEKYF